MNQQISHNSTQVSDNETEHHYKVYVSLKEQLRKIVMEITMEIAEEHNSGEGKDDVEIDHENTDDEN